MHFELFYVESFIIITGGGMIIIVSYREGALWFEAHWHVDF